MLDSKKMRIVIPGNPIAKARPKFCVRGKHAVAYDPQKQLCDERKAELSFLVKQDSPDDFEGYFSLPLRVALSFLMPVAETGSAALKNAKKWHFELPSHKPDIDNLIKLVLDLCNGILWRDDAQIVELHAFQKYSENPCTIIDVSPIKKLMTENTKKIAKIFSPSELELLNVHLCVLKNALAQFESCPENEKNFMAEHASLELITFANEYAQKLNKIRDK